MPCHACIWFLDFFENISISPAASRYSSLVPNGGAVRDIWVLLGDTFLLPIHFVKMGVLELPFPKMMPALKVHRLLTKTYLFWLIICPAHTEYDNAPIQSYCAVLAQYSFATFAPLTLAQIEYSNLH